MKSKMLNTMETIILISMYVITGEYSIEGIVL